MSDETWYAVFDPDGSLVSTGTVIDADDLAACGRTWQELAFRPAGHVWDAEQKAFVKRPRRPTLLSVYAYKSRFTTAERQTLLQASDHDKRVHDWLDMLQHAAIASIEINPASDDQAEAIAYFVGAGFIAAERTAVLTAP